ncbi:fluoride efflux transporter CrcB [Nitrospirillum sp. BR 11752]|uniref:Fluoride-specific ion channel FluC n=1 Tax=Nitrospirillum amazonense TaxID=28077 RepID=A0A560HCP2_9PROT|nr:fluoride efflux transporter CrcB [Nitrospirillum amazonense]MEE3627058.1 fluoride efflux transporter CrcB [Nitrospirillum sp. BR 11752]TWB44136.1 camphor resistance protein CrcB [Nitrospirillum amazonense]
MIQVMAVALGGALGSVLRYLSQVWLGRLLGLDFPWGTLFVNVVGSLIMGVLAELAARVWSPTPELRAFLVVGVLGGFTTFSSFSLDIGMLVSRDDWMVAMLYFMATLVVGVGGLFVGMALVRAVVT